MPCKAYLNGSMRANGRAMVRMVNKIIEEYNEMGYQLTLRQVYYQMVARDIIPNNDKSYNNLGELISKGRMLGLIDWYAIEDRTRYLRALSHWISPSDRIESAIHSYHIDLWEDQPNYVEVWVEKDALIGVVEQVADSFDVPCFSCRGYTSQTAMWDAGQRMIHKSRAGQRPVKIIHLGDHDPSGIDMTRDIIERINLFLRDGLDKDAPSTIPFDVNRIALNMAQIKEYKPPKNPAKVTDSRYKKYIDQFGKDCWELDALKPNDLAVLIGNTIRGYMDIKRMDKRKVLMEEQKAMLKDAAEFVEHPDRWTKSGNAPYYFGT